MDKIWEYVKKKWRDLRGKKAEEDGGDKEDGEEKIGSYSMNEGKTEKVFGINRSIVTGIGGFFALVFVIAVLFNALDSEEVAQVDKQENLADDEIAKVGQAKNNLPNDYESFVAMRQEKDKAQQAQQSVPKQQTQAKIEEKPAEVKAQTTTPVIPKSSYPEILLPQPQTVPQVQIPQIATAEPEKQPEEKKEREKYGAPIAFSSFTGAKDAEKNSEGEGEEVKQSTKVSYQKVNAAGIGAGTIMSARLLTGINSEMEGQVVAQILSDVYNTGRTKILIPQGSKVIGMYKKSEVSSDRVPVEFDKIILPDGGQLKVEKNLVTVDGAGYTGIKGKVHRHTGQKITAGVMGAAIAAMGSAAAGNSSGSGNNNYSVGELAKQGAMANLMNVTSKMFEDASKIGKTITVEPGYEFQIYVKEDLEF